MLKQMGKKYLQITLKSFVYDKNCIIALFRNLCSYALLYNSALEISRQMPFSNIFKYTKQTGYSLEVNSNEKKQKLKSRG